VKNLTAKNLKLALWETLVAVKEGTTKSDDANAVAAQAREILRTIKVQAAISSQSQRPIPADVLAFAENQQD
jgi:hypothetical protein